MAGNLRCWRSIGDGSGAPIVHRQVEREVGQAFHEARELNPAVH
jgi:hypothetical protein